MQSGLSIVMNEHVVWWDVFNKKVDIVYSVIHKD